MPQELHDFCWALMQLKTGKRVRRDSWKDAFIFIVPGSTFQVKRPPFMHIFPINTEVHYHSHINIKTTDGDIMPWVASQSDLLDQDWVECLDALPEPEQEIVW